MKIVAYKWNLDLSEKLLNDNFWKDFKHEATVDNDGDVYFTGGDFVDYNDSSIPSAVKVDFNVNSLNELIRVMKFVKKYNFEVTCRMQTYFV